MNPIVFNLGPLEIHAFTAWIMLGAALSMALILGMAARQQRRLMPWLDALIGAVIGGLVGARAFHVWLSWTYFSANTGEIFSLSSGGLDWHGALFGGLIGASLIGLVRRVPLSALMDAFALAVPIGAIAIWQGCAAANCAYGLEVRSLADYPAWLVTESADVYGTVAPRLNLLPPGIILAVILFAFITTLLPYGWLRGLRLWLALIVYGLGMALIDFFRAEYVPQWFGRRADQVLDLAVVLLAVIMFALVALRQAALKHRVLAQTSPQEVESNV
jgi:phosphatidylglycerol:prolipoprotein diacylglycerol transferase